MTREEAVQFAKHAQTMTDIPEVKEFYAMAEAALRDQEQTNGKWFEVQLTKRTKNYKCSVCGHWEDRIFPYCNCGAKMKLEE